MIWQIWKTGDISYLIHLLSFIFLFFPFPLLTHFQIESIENIPSIRKSLHQAVCQASKLLQSPIRDSKRLEVSDKNNVEPYKLLDFPLFFPTFHFLGRIWSQLADQFRTQPLVQMCCLVELMPFLLSFQNEGMNSLVSAFDMCYTMYSI